MLLTTKQLKGESIEHFFGKLKELSKNCELGSQEDTLIKDLFIVNMQDPEIQKELLRETLEPAQALRLAINMELEIILLSVSLFWFCTSRAVH